MIKFLFAIICCSIFVTGIAYGQTAQSDVGTMEIEQELYVLNRTVDLMVKVFGSVDLDYNPPKVLVTHTTPDGESLTHNIRVNSEGYYEFYFFHDWNSVQGNYDVFVSKSNYPYAFQIPIGTISYDLIRDPTYKSDQQVKEEYWAKAETRTELILAVKNAFELYERNGEKETLWVKNVFDWYYMDRITGEQVISVIQFLEKNNIIKSD